MKEKTKANITATLILISCFSIVFGACWWFVHLPHQNVRQIEVNGQMCDVLWKEDGRTSHGASWGHDVAVCRPRNCESKK
jgi:hypothetical protein